MKTPHLQTRNTIYARIVLKTLVAHAKSEFLTHEQIAKLCDARYETYRIWRNRFHPRSMPLDTAHLLAWRLDMGQVALKQPDPAHSGERICQQLAFTRDKLKIRTKPFADCLGVDARTLTRWEGSWDKGPDLGELERWATLLFYPGITLTVPRSPNEVGPLSLLDPLPAYAIPIVAQGEGLDPAWYVPRTDEWVAWQMRGAAVGVSVDLFRNEPAYLDPTRFQLAYRTVVQLVERGHPVDRAVAAVRTRVVTAPQASQAPAHTLTLS